MKEAEPVPLKTILQNFLNHVENLEARRAEGEDTYDKEFQALKAFSDELKTREEYSTSEGDRDVNKKKNRYKDILPFNYTRVPLSDYPGVPGSDYINANYIKGASGSNAYIASQGPLPHTVNDFWRMVVECEVQVIVMACNEQEAGKHKCENYWTQEEEREKQFGKFFVSLLKSRDICPDFLVRTMRLKWTGEGGKEEERTVCQFHYSAWPDHGIPTQVKPLLEMVRLIRDCQASETLPVLVHCSAGCGRTGTICAIDFVWGLLRTGKLTADFSLFNLVKEMRKQRIAMVQTVDQYMLCHRAVKELFLEQLRVIDSHPYENVGDDGRPLAGRESSECVIPDYETIFVKGQEMDIDRVLSQRQQSLPRTVMGTAMLSRERSPPTIQDKNGEVGGEESTGAGLPATLEDFSSTKNSRPKIHDPPKAPENPKETAPQRFKKGNLRLLQTEDGGWKLEELEEKRRSLDGGNNNNNNSPRNNNNASFEEDEEEEGEGEMRQRAASSGAAETPTATKSRKERRKKSAEEGKSESQLLRRPSMKKIKAFFDNGRSSSKKEEEKERTDSDYAAAVSKLPKIETLAVNMDIIDSLPLPGSKSVPSSLDRKYKSKEANELGTTAVEAQQQLQNNSSSNNNLSKYWPLSRGRDNRHAAVAKSVSSERLQAQSGEKPALPVKRSKSMKVVSKPVSVIPLISVRGEPSFSRDEYTEYRTEDEPKTPGPFGRCSLPKSRSTTSDELIDLTRKPESDMAFSFDLPIPAISAHSRQGSADSSGKQPPPTTPYYHFGERNNSGKKLSMPTMGAAAAGPPKPRRDWSSLTTSTPQQQTPPDYVNMRLSAAVGGHDSGGDSSSLHARQSSNDSSLSHGDSFLEQQMAKLLARKEESGSQASLMMKRSRSGDIPRPDSLSLVRSVSGELRSGVQPPQQQQRGSEILDEDARRMLKDCQEYLLGAFDHLERRHQQQGNQATSSAEHSPLNTIKPQLGQRSVHSSPGNSFNKYHASMQQHQLMPRSASGSLLAVSSPTGTAQRSFCSALSDPEDGESPLAALSSGSETTGPSSLEQQQHHEYENVEQHVRLAVEARSKLLMSAAPRSRERRNSFRQAMDQLGRPYEQIWFKEEEEMDGGGGGHRLPGGDQQPPGSNNTRTNSDPIPRNSVNIDTRQLADGGRKSIGSDNLLAGSRLEHPASTVGEGPTRPQSLDGPVYANASRIDVKKYHPAYTPSALEEQRAIRRPEQAAVGQAPARSQHSNIRSGSYDNILPTELTTSSATEQLRPLAMATEANVLQQEVNATNNSNYEPVNFNRGNISAKKNSFDYTSSQNAVGRPSEESQSGLASVVLVAEACRDYERQQPTGPQQHPPNNSSNKPLLQKQNSTSSLLLSSSRLPPPPYLAPPPGPIRQTRPLPASSPSSTSHLLSKTDTRPGSDPSPIFQDMSTPKRPTAHLPSSAARYKSGPAPYYSPQSQVGAGGVMRRQPRETIGGVKDDSMLPTRSRDEHVGVRHMKRNSSLVTTARLGMPPDFYPPAGLVLKGGEQQPIGGSPLIVQGSRTAVMVGGGGGGGPPPPLRTSVSGGSPGSGGKLNYPAAAAPLSPPGVDIDRVAAMLTSDKENSSTVPLSQVAAVQGRQLGRSLAGVLSGAAANLRSRLAGIADAGVRSGPRGSPSPPLNKKEDLEPVRVREVPINRQDIPLTVPGAELTRDYGYPIRIEKKPQGPRETPGAFQKKQEYL